MKTKILAALTCITLIGITVCNAQQTRPAALSVREKINRSALIGIWWSSEMPQSAAFEIKDSSFYYPDSFSESRYSLRGDTLFMHLEDGTVSTIIIRKVTADTLILFSWDIEQIYTRSEPQPD